MAGLRFENSKIGGGNIREGIALQSLLQEHASLIGLAMCFVEIAECGEKIRVIGIFGEGLRQEFLGLGDGGLHAAFGERLPSEREIAGISGRSGRKAFQDRFKRS